MLIASPSTNSRMASRALQAFVIKASDLSRLPGIRRRTDIGLEPQLDATILTCVLLLPLKGCEWHPLKR